MMNPDMLLETSIDEQTLTVSSGGRVIAVFPVSTAARGMGCQAGSLRTPTGQFRVVEKIGDGLPVHTIFRGRQPGESWSPEHPPCDDLVLTRILVLEGMEPENANTRDRYIYIHGTNREDLIGTPSSHGCIRLANADMIELFDLVPVDTPLVVHPATRQRGKLFFIDCDSTLSSIEGIDELARVRGPELFAEVAALTEAAMNGEVPLDEVFGRRMAVIRPDAAACAAVADAYIAHTVPGIPAFVDALKDAGWTVVIISGGFAPLIAPLAARLGIRHIEAVPLHLNTDGSYAGYGSDYPTTRNGGKNEIIRDWARAMLPERVVMMGDGISDLETKPDVDLFIGFGGVVCRDRVKAGAGLWVDAMPDDPAALVATFG